MQQGLSRVAHALLIGVAALALTGCVEAGPSVETPDPASSSLDERSPDSASTPTAVTLSPASSQPATTSTPSGPPISHATPAPSTPVPSLPPGLVLARADVSIKCGSTDLGNYLMVSDGLIYVDCPDYGQHGAILEVNPTTAKVTKTLMLSRLGDLRAVDHGIWVDWPGMRACAQSGCVAYLDRLDPATGQVTLHFDDSLIAAAGLGYVWVFESPDIATRIDTKTLARTAIPLPGGLEVACGSLFSVGLDGYHRLDPATGALLADIADSKGVSHLTDVNGQCWGIVTDVAQPRAQFVRMGQTAVDYRGAWISGPNYAPELEIIGDGFWLTQPPPAGYEFYRLQQVDPTTGLSLGTAWAVPGIPVELVAAGGRIWWIDDRQDDALERLNITSDPLFTPPAP
jgi:hypothetical protein